MKKISLLLSLLLTISCLFTFTSCSKDEANNDESNIETVKDALIYTFPLMMMDATMTNYTNTIDAAEGHAPVNYLNHSDKLADASFKDVVSPNRDTVYSQAYLDLDDGPLVFIKPKTDRFCSVEILDFYTNAIAILGSGGKTQDEEICVIMKENYEGDLPENASIVKCPTTKAVLLVRTVVYDNEDMDNVEDIQNSMKMIPLDYYFSGEEYIPEKGTYDESNNYIPVEHVMALSPDEYFARANELMETNSPTEEDEEMLKKISSAGVGPGMKFDMSYLGENAEDTWREILSEFQTDITANSGKFMVDLGGWTFSGKPIAEFGTEYEYRALIALVGLLANPVSVAVYPTAYTDSNGDTLDGKNNYVIHFDKDSLPPTETSGFWSITAYNENHLFIDNKLDRYLINDRSDYALNDDDSLDIYVQADKPDDEASINNWLPITDGNFSLMMRVYLPRPEIVEGDWIGPTIIKQ